MLNKINSWDHKSKFKVILIATLLSVLLIYKWAIADTIRLCSRISSMEDQFVENSNSGHLSKTYFNQTRLLQKITTERSQIKSRVSLTHFVNRYIKEFHCEVDEIPAESRCTANGLAVKTNIFNLKGQFPALLAVANQVENGSLINSKLKAAKFYTLDNLQKHSTELYMTLYTQSIEKDEK
jgi:hypothetical protein